MDHGTGTTRLIWKCKYFIPVNLIDAYTCKVFLLCYSCWTFSYSNVVQCCIILLHVRRLSIPSVIWLVYITSWLSCIPICILNQVITNHHFHVVEHVLKNKMNWCLWYISIAEFSLSSFLLVMLSSWSLILDGINGMNHCCGPFHCRLAGAARACLDSTLKKVPASSSVSTTLISSACCLLFKKISAFHSWDLLFTEERIAKSRGGVDTFGYKKNAPPQYVFSVADCNLFVYK